MQQPTALAIRRCGTYLCVIFAFYCFVATGAYASLLMGAWPGANPFSPFKGGNIRLTLVGAVILGVFFYLDYQALTDPKLQWAPVKKPTKYPLEYAAVRYRRYALIPFGLLYMVLVFRLTGFADWWVTKEPDKGLGTLTNWCLFAFGVLFADSRRPLFWTHGDAFGQVMHWAGKVGEGMSRGR